MKKTLLFLFLLLILCLGVFYFLLNEETQTKDSVGLVIKDVQENASANSETDEELNTSVDEQSEELFLVTYVVDGDTLEIETGERVRLICIDTPEKGEDYYSDAKEFLEDLVLDKKVKLEKDISETDRYGRLLRYIYLEDGTFVNEEIVKEGYAEAYWYNPDTTLCPIIQDAEDYARKKDLGMWEDEEEDEDNKDEETEEEPDEQAPENCQCDDDLDCGDFSTHIEAQNCYNYCWDVKGYDFHKLDRDGDGLACEGLD